MKRKVLCRPGVVRVPEGSEVVHRFRSIPIRRRLGFWSDDARRVTVGFTYRCDRCGEPGHGVPA